jgi:hypothetical protein
MPRRATGTQHGGPALEEYRRKRDFGRTGEPRGGRAGQLRHPRYLGLRRDKDPATVTREVAR